MRLRAIVAADGKTKGLIVLSGPAIFTKPTLDAVRKWHFYPSLQKDLPVETMYIVEMRFNLTLEEAIPHITLESPTPTEPPVPRGEPLGSPNGPVYRLSLGSGIIAPKVVYQVDPEFSEEARRAKVQGTVEIRLVVGMMGFRGISELTAAPRCS